MSKEPRLAGKTCIISGASRGFGQTIAIRFVEEGANVVMLSRSSIKETMELVYQIEGITKEYADAHTLWVAADIGSEAECNKAAADSVAKFGPAIHCLVNNAAYFTFHSVEHASPEDWDRSAAINIKGHAMLTKACLPYMKNLPASSAGGVGGATIIFQGSISSFLAQPNCATYSTMKGAIVQLARNCAYDFAKYSEYCCACWACTAHPPAFILVTLTPLLPSLAADIRVNSVCAGTIETPISAEERKAHNWSYDQWESLKVKDVMLGRVGHTREIANATLFFASDESSYCTATHLLVDGGQVPCTVMEYC